jgi:methionine aminopeptidase
MQAGVHDRALLSSKAREAVDTGDGWTLAGPAGSVTAQYEHTLGVGRHGPIVVTDLGWVH